MNAGCWSELAYGALREGVRPGQMRWDTPDLFGAGGASIPRPAAKQALTEAHDLLFRPTIFAKLVRSVACHRDPTRWDSLYAALWRIAHGEAELLTVVTDPLVHRLVQMHRNVKRASHKMKAFVRFRLVEADERYIAWFEPAHDVVERTAPFFARRFTSMKWSILTPDRCAHWDRATLSFTAGVSRSAAPTDDALEDLWRTYYANIFNPARLNGRAMRTEMPQRYWHNLPEARIIGDLRERAPARVREMLAQVSRPPDLLPSEYELHDAAPAVRASPLDEPGEWDPAHDPGAAAARARAEAAQSPTWCQVKAGEGTVDFGVAGWTDPTLIADGVFYPPECRTAESRLRYYASRFPMVEVDSTYYSLPGRATAAAWAARTPDGFTFDVKANALMTGHPTEVKRLPDWVRRELPRRDAVPARIYSSDLPPELLDEVWSRFRSALDPIRSTGKLGAIMLQYPRWFEPTRSAARELERAKVRLGDDLGTIEFRNRRWMEGRVGERTLALLKELALSYVIVDAPQGMESSMPRSVAVTDSRLVVFRLHGRRAATWEKKNDPVTERYRYLYDGEELRSWLPGMRETAFNVARVHVTFNNNHANYATTNAVEMRGLFDGAVDGTSARGSLGSRGPGSL